MTGLRGDLFATWDQLTSLGFISGWVSQTAGVVGELSAQDFDTPTITEAATAVELMHTSVRATQEAGVSADALLAAINEF